VRALEQAERSAQQSVISSIKGVEAGTRNSVDVLNALQQVSATRQELVQARYTYAFDRLKLKAAAGSLGESDIVEITHVNLNDKSIEGIRVKNKKAFSVQYHPESAPGPDDSRYLFDEFVGSLKVNIGEILTT